MKIQEINDKIESLFSVFTVECFNAPKFKYDNGQVELFFSENTCNGRKLCFEHKHILDQFSELKQLIDKKRRRIGVSAEIIEVKYFRIKCPHEGCYWISPPEPTLCYAAGAYLKVFKKSFGRCPKCNSKIKISL